MKEDRIHPKALNPETRKPSLRTSPKLRENEIGSPGESYTRADTVVFQAPELKLRRIGMCIHVKAYVLASANACVYAVACLRTFTYIYTDTDTDTDIDMCV